MSTDLDGATSWGHEGSYPATPGEFAARWNAKTEERRAEWLKQMVDDAAAAQSRDFASIRALEEQQSVVAKLREGSESANRMGWRIALATGAAVEGQGEVTVDPEALLTALITDRDGYKRAAQKLHTVLSCAFDVGPAAALRDAILAIHQPSPVDKTCYPCGDPWPCATARAVGVVG